MCPFSRINVILDKERENGLQCCVHFVHDLGFQSIGLFVSRTLFFFVRKKKEIHGRGVHFSTDVEITLNSFDKFLMNMYDCRNTVHSCL